MPQPDGSKIEEQLLRVSEFISEHRPIVEDPEAGYNALSRIYVLGADLMSAVNGESIEATNRAVQAAERLTDMLRDPHCSPGKINKREKEHKRLKAQSERIRGAVERLGGFLDETKACMDAVAEEEQAEDTSTTDAPIGREGEPQVRYSAPARKNHAEPRSSWFGRLFGAREKSEEPKPPEDPPAPTEVEDHSECDREDYQKLLSWYEQNLEVMEELVATRQRNEAVYRSNPEMVERWQKTYDKLNGEIEWACRNMDAIEQRDAEIAVSEAISEREDLVARRSELEVTS